MKDNKLTIIIILLLTTLLSCDKDDPDINYDQLIIGQWNETKAVDSFTDFINPSKSKQTDATMKTNTLTFKPDLKFYFSQTNEILDSGKYYFSTVENHMHLNTSSVDNTRVPKILNLPVRFSTYQVSEITKNKLVLRSKISDARDLQGNLLSRREFIWELSRP